MIINLRPNKITFIVEIKWQILREERYKHKDNTQCVIEEETEALSVKPLCRPPSGKQSPKECSWDTWTAGDPPSLIYSMYLSPPSSYSNEVTPNLFLL